MQLNTSVFTVDVDRLVASRQALAEEFRLLHEEYDQVVTSHGALTPGG